MDRIDGNKGWANWSRTSGSNCFAGQCGWINNKRKRKKMCQVQLVQFSCSVVSNSLWPHGLQHTGLPVHHQLPELTQTHVHWVGNAIQPSHPLLSPSPPAFNLSQHQVFSNESVLHIRWPLYRSFSFSISPSNEHSGLISFRMDWLDLLAVQGILKSLLQHHGSNHQFFGAQLSL